MSGCDVIDMYDYIKELNRNRLQCCSQVAKLFECPLCIIKNRYTYFAKGYGKSDMEIGECCLHMCNETTKNNCNKTVCLVANTIHHVS